MKPRVVVLGSGSVSVDEDVPREGPGAPLDGLLDTAPSSVIVADEGDGAFFRASVAFERGVRRVVVRRGAMSQSVLGELSARAAELGGELFVRGDDARYERVRAGSRCEVGAPLVEAFEACCDPTPAGGAMPMLEVRDAERSVRCEEVAFSIGLKPVLYLVVPRGELEALIARYPGFSVVTESDRLAASAGSGERNYGAGDEVVHVFVSHAAGAASAAARLWVDDSSRNVEALGAAMGYPACCVRAFAAMASRRVNAAFPYVTAARTRALGLGFDVLLDATSSRLVPFVPCTYSCARAVDWARRVAEAAGLPPREHRLVLYLDELRAITFEHAVSEREGRRVEYRDPRWAGPDGPESLRLRSAWGGAFGGQGSFELTERTLEVRSDRGDVSLARTGGLGVVLPFESNLA